MGKKVLPGKEEDPGSLPHEGEAPAWCLVARLTDIVTTRVREGYFLGRPSPALASGDLRSLAQAFAILRRMREKGLVPKRWL